MGKWNHDLGYFLEVSIQTKLLLSVYVPWVPPGLLQFPRFYRPSFLCIEEILWKFRLLCDGRILKTLLRWSPKLRNSEREWQMLWMDDSWLIEIYCDVLGVPLLMWLSVNIFFEGSSLEAQKLLARRHCPGERWVLLEIPCPWHVTILCTMYISNY